MTILGAVVAFINILIILCLIKLGKQKLKAILTPDPYANYKETYCVISVNMVSWAQVMLKLLAVYNTIEMFGYILGPHYDIMVLPIDQPTCKILGQTISIQ